MSFSFSASLFPHSRLVPSVSDYFPVSLYIPVFLSPCIFLSDSLPSHLPTVLIVCDSFSVSVFPCLLPCIFASLFPHLCFRACLAVFLLSCLPSPLRVSA